MGPESRHHELGQRDGGLRGLGLELMARRCRPRADELVSDSGRASLEVDVLASEAQDLALAQTDEREREGCLVPVANNGRQDAAGRIRGQRGTRGA